VVASHPDQHILVVLALVKATWALEGKHDALTARLADRAQRKADAAELGALRRRMRKRHRDWLREQNHGVRMLGFASARAQALQSEIGAHHQRHSARQDQVPVIYGVVLKMERKDHRYRENERDPGRIP
jgi:hypothetical protein